MRSEFSRVCNSPPVRRYAKSDSKRAEELFSQLEEKIDAYDRPSCFSSFDSSISRMNQLVFDGIERESELDNPCIYPQVMKDRISNFVNYNISSSSYPRSKGFQSVSSSPDPTKSMKSRRCIMNNNSPGYISTARDSKTANKRSLRSLRHSPLLSLEEEEDVINTVKTKLNEDREGIARQALNKYYAWNNHGIFPEVANKLRYQTLISTRMKNVYKAKYKSYYKNAKNEYLEHRTYDAESYDKGRSTLLEKIEEVAVRKLPAPVITMHRQKKKLDVAASIEYNLRVKLRKRTVKPVILCSEDSMSPSKYQK